MATKEGIMEEKGMEKEDFYKYLGDLEKLSKMQLLMVKSMVDGLLKETDNVHNIATTSPFKFDNIPNCCKHCPNFKEGAICHCTLPYMEQFREPIGQPFVDNPLPIRTITTDGTGVYTEPNTTITSGNRPISNNATYNQVK